MGDEKFKNAIAFIENRIMHYGMHEYNHILDVANIILYLETEWNNSKVEVTKLQKRVDALEAYIANYCAPIISEKYQNLADCQSALISMVQQYLYRPLDPTTNEPVDNLYQHDFMSAGEEAFAYLVEHGLAEWTDHEHWAIILKESEGE